MFKKTLIHNGNTGVIHSMEKKRFSHTAQSNAGIITLGALMLIYFHEVEKHKQEFPPFISI